MVLHIYHVMFKVDSNVGNGCFFFKKIYHFCSWKKKPAFGVLQFDNGKESLFF